MQVNELYQANVTRAGRWHTGGMDEWSVLEWAAAMAGEAGEAANAAKKLKRLECGIASINEGDRHFSDLAAARREVAKEAADTMIYALLLMARVGVEDPEEIIRSIFNRKSEEYGLPERL